MSCSIIIIDNTPIRTPPPSLPLLFPVLQFPQVPSPERPPVTSSSPSAKLTSFPTGGSAVIPQLATNSHYSSSNLPQINQLNLVGALPISLHDSLRG
ncbi:hypothetical protein O181_016075 [Austropuccinia psidii MF-1]|uniref:Uncharacterized protein n=1 Tax=Austropuccinia psidii MF-1 TaxID=1389203 RepID=A0A9Q3C462_9BASI|nr:hypothetical protein [Austropuccinia psidii MF-1]